jgi:hypothetical protein
MRGPGKEAASVILKSGELEIIKCMYEWTASF